MSACTHDNQSFGNERFCTNLLMEHITVGCFLFCISIKNRACFVMLIFLFVLHKMLCCEKNAITYLFIGINPGYKIFIDNWISQNQGWEALFYLWAVSEN